MKKRKSNTIFVFILLLSLLLVGCAPVSPCKEATLAFLTLLQAEDEMRALIRGCKQQESSCDEMIFMKAITKIWALRGYAEAEAAKCLREVPSDNTAIVGSGLP